MKIFSVFFSLPLVLLFYPGYDKVGDHKMLKTLFDSNEVSIKKYVIIDFFCDPYIRWTGVCLASSYC
jgi:hypothetical protein